MTQSSNVQGSYNPFVQSQGMWNAQNAPRPIASSQGMGRPMCGCAMPFPPPMPTPQIGADARTASPIEQLLNGIRSVIEMVAQAVSGIAEKLNSFISRGGLENLGGPASNAIPFSNNPFSVTTDTQGLALPQDGQASSLFGWPTEMSGFTPNSVGYPQYPVIYPYGQTAQAEAPMQKVEKGGSGVWETVRDFGKEVLFGIGTGLLGKYGKIGKTAGKYIGKGWNKLADYASKGYEWLSSSKVGKWAGQALDWVTGWF